MALNLNVGILGHVDSGKTTLAKGLSEIASTACFDKNPQSQTRGITLDLGFSSFTLPTPEHLINDCEHDKIQYTLVDCPGHASLIRTIIGGAQIIDMMLLIIDVTKGIQTQTAECLIIGELLCGKMIVVLNKVDLLPETKRRKSVEKMTKKLQTTLKSTIFHDSPIISIAALPNNNDAPLGINDLLDLISKYSFVPNRQLEANFLFAIDHCFGIKGHGTVMTGTVLQGQVKINDEIEIASLGITKRVKSMQMFKKQVSKAAQGDRVGICVTQFDPKLLERGVAASIGYASFATLAIVSAKKIKYFKSEIKTKSKYHITIGHETTVATITCFSTENKCSNKFDFNIEYNYQTDLPGASEMNESQPNYFFVLEFDKPTLVVPGCTVIGSKLDMDTQTTSCRLAFSGRLLEFYKDKDLRSSFLNNLKVYKEKQKIGVVERCVNDNEVIVKHLFKKETNLQLFLGLKVTFSNKETGRIESSFGQSGKVKIYVQDGLSKETLDGFQQSKQKTIPYSPIEVFLKYKHNVFSNKQNIIQ